MYIGDRIESVRRTNEQANGERASERVSRPRVINEQRRTVKILRPTGRVYSLKSALSLFRFVPLCFSFSPSFLRSMSGRMDDDPRRGTGWRLLAWNQSLPWRRPNVRSRAISRCSFGSLIFQQRADARMPRERVSRSRDKLVVGKEEEATR